MWSLDHTLILQNYSTTRLFSKALVVPQISGTRSCRVPFQKIGNAFLLRSFFRLGTHVPFCVPFAFLFGHLKYQYTVICLKKFLQKFSVSYCPPIFHYGVKIWSFSDLKISEMTSNQPNYDFPSFFFSFRAKNSSEKERRRNACVPLAFLVIFVVAFLSRSFSKNRERVPAAFLNFRNAFLCERVH